MSSGELRGGAYFVFREPRSVSKLPVGLWTLFLASTVGLTGIVSFYITRSILRPIENLASVSRRIRDGDLTAVPRTLTSDDEIADLTRSVSAMLLTLRQHREELERECALAADRAKRAEHELLTAQRLASLGTLAAGVAHEINNPLGGMQNALRQLELGSLSPEKRRDYFDLVREGLGRVESIVKTTLSMAPRSLTVGPMRISDAVRDARALVNHRIVKEDAKLVEAVLTEDDWIRGARGEVSQLFLNLFINALDALADFRTRPDPPPRGWEPTVECVVESDGQWVRVEVRDNGGGARAEDLDRVFDPFFTTKEPGRGSGLGLAVAYGIVRHHGGRIAAENRPTGGFVVRILWPRLDSPEGKT
jgi:signal transduction histidine kinase